MIQIWRLEQIINDYLVADKRTHIEAERILAAIKERLDNSKNSNK